METNSMLENIAISNIQINKSCIRKIYDEETITDLSQSILEKGVLQPIIVKELKKNEYELIIGSRRLKAVKKLVLSNIPAFVMRNVDDREITEMMLTENLQREDLTPFEEAWAISKLVNQYGMSVIEIAKKIGKCRDFIYQRIKLINLPEELKELVIKKKIGLTHIDHLASIDSPEEQIELGKLVAEHSLSENELSTFIQDEQEKIIERKREYVKFTGKKICLRIRGFINLLKDIMPHVMTMNAANILNIEAELKSLRKEINNAIIIIEKEI